MRRTMQFVLATACALAAMIGPGRAEQPLAFTVLRDGAPIGTHRVTFSRQGADTIAQVEIDLRVRFAGIPVYRYQHSSRETWRGGRLVALEARTDDNGARSTVSVQAAGGGLVVDGPAGRFTAPAEIIPTSYWRRDTVQRAQLLDTQSGRLAAISAGAPAVETKTLAGRALRVRYWTLSGDLDLAVAYSDDGAWAGMRFRFRGSDFMYSPTEGHVLLAAR